MEQEFDGECEVCGSREGHLMRDGSILCLTHGTQPYYSFSADD